MSKSFDVHVDGVTRAEFLAAARGLDSRKTVPVIILTLAATLFLLLFGEAGASVIFLPVFVIGGTLGYYEIINRRNFKKFPKDLQMDYTIDEHGWRLYVQGGTGICSWGNTLKMTDTKEVFLLYNSKATSNLLPKRCLTEEQIQQIRLWYKERFNLSAAKEEDENQEDEF